MPEIKVIREGLYTSIQDQGRSGYRKYGVPQSGAMDQRAASLANLLLQNPPHAAVLEITLLGPQLEFPEPTQLVITGARLSPVLGKTPLENNRIYMVAAGERLNFGKRTSGYRAYLGVKNGFSSKVILGSRSWCPGITVESRLKRGMYIPYTSVPYREERLFSSVRHEDPSPNRTLRVYPGPEYDHLSSEERDFLFNRPLYISKDSNRMGIRFEQKLQNALAPIITGPVLPGTVQLTPSGTMIALMRDCQTTGGYPRILQISDGGLNILAQKLPGESIDLSLSF